MRTMILALLLVLASNLAVAVEPGVYYCVTERMVGIWPQRQATGEENFDYSDIPRKEGIIDRDFTPGGKKFIVKISRIDETKRKSLCETVRTTPGPRYAGHVLYCSDVVVWEAYIPGGKLPSGMTVFGSLVSDNDVLFTADGSATLYIGMLGMEKGTYYTLTRLQGAQGNFLEEGHCETFQE